MRAAMLKLPELTFSGLFLKSQMDTLAGLGFPLSEQFAVIGEDPSTLRKPSSRIGIDAVEALYAVAETRTEHPNIGLATGFEFRVATFSRTGSVYAHCSNLREVSEMNHRYEPLAETMGRSYFRRNDDQAWLEWVPHFDDHDRYRHLTDVIFGAFATTFRWLSWASGIPTQGVCLAHAQPRDISTYRRVFDCPVMFSQPKNRLIFMPGREEEPLPTANPQKLSQVISRLDAILYPDRAGESLEAALRHAIRDCLGKGAISLQIVAQHLDMRERQLRSRLKQEKISYRDTLEAVRKQIFLDLGGQKIPLAQIAYRLGYSDQSAFTRAVRRWYGVSPSAFEFENLNI